MKRIVLGILPVMSLLVFGRTANAYVKTFAPSLCIRGADNQPDKSPLQVGSNGQAGNASSVLQTWFCPVTRDSTNQFENANAGAVVTGWSEGPGSLVVESCSLSATSGTLKCDVPGSAQESSQAGIVGLAWNAGSAWRSAGLSDAFYILVFASPGATVFSYVAKD
jgi:hypothetical protein